MALPFHTLSEVHAPAAAASWSRHSASLPIRGLRNSRSRCGNACNAEICSIRQFCRTVNAHNNNLFTTKRRTTMQSMTTSTTSSRFSQEKEPRWPIKKEIITKMIGLFLQQLSEKIDRIRLLSGSLLQKFFDDYSHLFVFPDKQIL